MDLTVDQHKQLTRVIEDWSKDSTLELESTFGVKGVVDSNTFLQIAKRLRSKSFEVMPQDDHLNIITPNHYRVSIQGIGAIQSYCRDDNLQNQSFSIIEKKSNSPDSTLDMHEYHIRVKMRRETELLSTDPAVHPLLANWKAEKKAFRLIRRWSFKGRGIRIDMSMVRQTRRTQEGEFEWTQTFLKKNVLLEPPRYEVEVELLHHTDATATPALALSSLIRGMGEVQRAIQKNTLLIRNSVAAQVRSEYQRLTGMNLFRGVNPITLQVQNMSSDIKEDIPNVRTGYNVTDKADGLRAMGFVDSSGELFLLDQSMAVYRTGLRNHACANSLVDGEWVTRKSDHTPIHHYLLFDIYHFDGKKVSELPFVTWKDDMVDVEGQSRYNKMVEWYRLWTTGMEIIDKSVTDATRLIVAVKRFEFASSGNTSVFKKCCSAILDASRIYHTDGLILTSHSQPLPNHSGGRFDYQFKWKPSIDNTIDFLVKYERHSDLPSDKVSTTIGPSGELIQYKTLQLYVGGTSRTHPRDIILNQLPIVRDAPTTYQSILFTPLDFPDTMAHTCYVPIQEDPDTLEIYSSTEDSKEPIPNCSTVEMRYDPSREPGWRWIPSRIRHDKGERLLRAKEKAEATKRDISYSGVMNDEKIANSVWNSIHEPITLSMIRTGTDQPAEEELRVILSSRDSKSNATYYQRNAPKENMALVKGLQDFHNKYIKSELLLKTALRTGKNLLDVACGKGGDLWKWINNGAAYVVGIDYAGENITNPHDGAYKRYVETITKFGRQRVPEIAFLIGNSSKSIVNGEAGANEQEKNMMRSIFGKELPTGHIPKYIEEVMAGKFRQGADIVACMFALHYFFETKETLDGFLANLSDTVKPNGLFIGCCFDGERVFQLLNRLEKGESREGTDGAITSWSITKQYDTVLFPSDDASVGLPIDVEFISIGSKHREYLVSFDYLKSRLAEMGFRLLNEVECKELGLVHSTATFEESYDMAAKQKMKFNMPDAVKEFSFLNRWFIFKRQGVIEAPPIELDVPEEEKEEEATEPVEAAPLLAYVLPGPNEPIPQKIIYPFGIQIGGNEILTGMNGEIDPNAARWLSLSAPFPIPDPLPDLTNPSSKAIPQGKHVMYPSIEHYLAAMKINHSKGSSLGESLIGPHSAMRTAFEREMHKLFESNPSTESSRFYKLLAREAEIIRKFMSSKSKLAASKVNIDEEQWMTARDAILEQALLYRFRFDKRFHEIVLSAKEKGLYLLYTKDKANNSVRATSSELYGSYEPGLTKGKGTIQGENKVGVFMMQMAGFQLAFRS